MGIELHLYISKSVTKEEWQSVFEEAMCLAEHLPLGEIQEIPVYGINVKCLVPSREREHVIKDWFDAKTSIETKWKTTANLLDYERTEPFTLCRDLIKEEQFNKNALGAISADMYCMNSADDALFSTNSSTYCCFAGKTQGTRSHIFLMAIAALVEARLGKKAYTSGDITKGQFVEAVSIANKFLEKKIDIPDSCDLIRLFNRINDIEIKEEDKLLNFYNLFIGRKDEEFGEFMRSHFSKEVIDAYWKYRFENIDVNCYSFNLHLQKYLDLGFSLKELGNYINFECKDENAYEIFVTKVMDSKIYKDNKILGDRMTIDQESKDTYGVELMMAQFFLPDIRNYATSTFLPINIVREQLREIVKDKCDVDKIIDEYLETEANLNENCSDDELLELMEHGNKEAITHMINMVDDAIMEENNQYDIVYPEDLRWYKKGCSVKPEITELLTRMSESLATVLEEDNYKELAQKTAEDQFKWIVKENSYLLLQEKDWQNVFKDIMTNKESFTQYYEIFRLKMGNETLFYVGQALVLNKELRDFVFNSDTKEQ